MCGQNSSPSSSLLGEALLDAIRHAVREAVREEIQGFNGTPTLESLLDAEQVAQILGVDTAYVYSRARAKKIPSVKLGKYRKFSPSQIKKWLDRKNTP
jgi:excisionase family DNA binding protein